MSPECEAFIQDVINEAWEQAYNHLNGLSTSEMQSAIAALDPRDQSALWAERETYASRVNFSRIDVAWNSVVTPRTPANHPSPLFFGRDLTGRLPPAGPQRSLVEGDFVAAARSLGVEVSAIQAVAEVESGGRSGFMSGRPIIRYELHVFHGQTNGVYARSHSHLSQPTLAKGEVFHVGRGSERQDNEWSLMQGAMMLRKPSGLLRRTEEAWKSASWGMFQVMGFNHAAGGWPSIEDMVTAMFFSEEAHLSGFVAFIRTGGLAGALKRQDWAAFAQSYNGADYRTNNYDTNMANAYTRISARRRRAGLPL